MPRHSPAPSSCSHVSGSSHPPGVRPRKRRRTSANVSFNESQIRVNSWNDGQGPPQSISMRRTVSDNTQNQSLRVSGEASPRFLDRTQQEIQMRTRISVLQTEIQRLGVIIQGRDELLHHTQREIEEKDEIIRHQRSQILSLTSERNYLKSTRDPFAGDSYSFMSVHEFPPRPRSPNPVISTNPVDTAHYLPPPRSWYRAPAEKSMSAPESASLSGPVLPPILLPSPWPNTRGEIHSERPSLQAGHLFPKMQLAPIEPRQNTLRDMVAGRDVYSGHLESGFTAPLELPTFQRYSGCDLPTSS